MSDLEDMFRRINAHPEIVTQCASLAEFAEQAPGCKGLAVYVGGWADDVWRQIKARPGVATYRPLMMPAALQFADLFAEARLAVAGRQFPGEDRSPADFHFCSGSNTDGAVPSGHFGKHYLQAFRANGEVVRGIGAASFHCTYVRPHPEVERIFRGKIGGDFAPSFEVIKRRDGLLVVMRDIASQGIFSVWLALLAPDAELLSMLPDADQQRIADDKARRAEIDACLDLRDGNWFIKEGVTPPCEVKPLRNPAKGY